MIYNFALGTIFSFICAALIVWSTFSKNKKDMAKIQIFNPIFGALSNIFLCSYSAVVTNLVNVIRNYLTYKGKLTKLITIVCIIFYIVFGLLFNSKGWIGIFPILASSSYAIFCLKSDNAQTLRYGLILNQILWLIHDLYIKAYPSMVVEILISIITGYNILRYSKQENIINKKYKILLAIEEDLEQINKLYADRVKWFNENNIEQWGNNYPNRYNVLYLKEQMKINKLYVMKNENKVIGSMLLKNEDSKYWEDTDNAYYIHHLVTDINTRGIGLELIKFAIEECINDRKEYLRLDTVSKNNWLTEYYQKLGFEILGSKEIKKGVEEKLWQMKIEK